MKGNAKRPRGAGGGPVHGKTPLGNEGFIMLGRQVNGPNIQVATVIAEEGRLFLDPFGPLRWSEGFAAQRPSSISSTKSSGAFINFF
jgi:hypothetical protein